MHAEEVRERIEASLWDYEPDWSPPGLVYAERPEMIMWASPVGMATSNKVVRACFTEQTVEAGMD